MPRCDSTKCLSFLVVSSVRLCPNSICKPEVICSNQIVGIVLFSLTLFRVESPWGHQTIFSCFAAAEFETSPLEQTAKGCGWNYTPSGQHGLGLG
jgi:hypothetical protein